MGEAFKTAPTRIESRRAGLWQQTGGRISCYPSPPLRDLPRGRRRPDERQGQKDLFGRQQGAYVGPDRTTRWLGFFDGFLDRAPIHLRRDDATRELSLPPHPATDVSAYCALSGVKSGVKWHPSTAPSIQ
jgi:hypothetical protein